MKNETKIISTGVRVIFGFIAGYVATIIFHQHLVWLLYVLGMSPFKPFPMNSVTPFGIPAVISLSFWGGVWGIIYAFIHGKFPSGISYWVTSFLSGGIVTSLVALVIVMPIKGMAMGGGWDPILLIVVFLVNGAWGVGTGLILKGLVAWTGK